MEVRRKLQLGVAGLVLLACIAKAQSKPEYAAPVSMPVDRIADSYVIYSKLLPSNVIEWGDARRSQWLVEDVTKAVPLNTACTGGPGLNPHTSVQPPEARRVEFAEVLADFDAHCHGRYQLEAAEFRLSLPVRLLDAEARDRFVHAVMGYIPPASDIMRAPATPEEFKGAAGMHSFSAVYFNHAHTLAMTEIGMYCGGLCGQWSWVVLERTPAGWRILPWVHTFVIS